MKFEKVNEKLFKPIRKEKLIKIKGGLDGNCFTRTYNTSTKKEDSRSEAD